MSTEKYCNTDANKSENVIKGIIDILFRGVKNSDTEIAEIAEYLFKKCKNDEDLKILRKTLEELNSSDNSSEFERQLPTIVDNVDFFQGTIDLGKMSSSDKDSEGVGNPTDAHNSNNKNIIPQSLENLSRTEATKKSGVDYVRSRIEHYLFGLRIAKNVLVEYSLLSSTLEPTNPDKLQCISFMKGELNFIDNVGKYYKACIDQTEIDKGISIYQHPRFLYDIDFDFTRKQYNSTFNAWADQLGVTGTFKAARNNGNSLKCIKAAENSIYKKVGDVYVAAFELERSFNEMLLNAKQINPDDCKQPQLVDIQNTLHSYCHENISNSRGEQSVYVAFPIYGSRSSNQLPKYEIKRTRDNKTALQGIGAFFIYFEPIMDLSKPICQQFVKIVMGKIAYEMGNFIRLISANYMFNLGLQLQEKARKEALKSARSAIMSRNMSHNLGSHVMSYLKQNLSSVNNIFNDRILALLVNDIDSLKIDNEIKNAIKDGDQGILPFLVGLGQFISYIQERQDFIATIATDFIPYLSTVNFKDFIYDELNPDKRYERHSTRKNYKTDNILLGNIARSEGLGRKTSPTGNVALNNIVIKFRDFDGDPVEKQDNQGHPTGKALEGREKEFNTLKEMRPYSFSLPGGVVGRQAIFSIVENVIRNAAKHGNWREKDQLELTFNIFTKEEIEMTDKSDIYLDDNAEAKGSLSLREVFNKFYIPAKDAKDLYFITLTDNLSMDEAKLEKLRKAIDEPLINDRGEMNEASKGLKEMRISSTWLRTLKEGEAYNPTKYKLDNDGSLMKIPETSWKDVDANQNAPILYARMSDGHLQYIFCVLRPKNVAIVSSRFTDGNNIVKKQDNNSFVYEEYNEKAFWANSWGAFTPKQYHDERNKSYEFVIYDDYQKNSEIDKEYSYDTLRFISSSRFWKLSEIDKLKKNDGEELFKKIVKLTEEDIKNVLYPLYKKLSNYELGDFILVDDKTAVGNVNRDSEVKKYIKSEHIVVQDGIKEKDRGVYKFIYRTHHDTATQYDNFINAVESKLIQDNLFVEGITGNNSTDRLVRNEKLDDIWFYKHLHAMKEQVAIFDERLFTKIFGLEESSLKSEGTLEINEENRKSYLKKYKKEILNGDKTKWDSLLKETYIEQDKILKDAFKRDLGPTTSKERADALTGNLPIVYKQKGIYLFTLIQDPNPSSHNQFSLYGLAKAPNLTRGVCEKIATLSWEKADGLKFKGQITNDNNTYMKFNAISIHQGLLDKLYEVFGIKDEPREKERLTKEFHKVLSLSQGLKVDKPDDNEKYFLPGFCVHSGRSKPSKLDMPQELPFIQYASIENAVLDCKYSLVELLDFARYE